MFAGSVYYDTARVPSEMFNNDELVGVSGSKSYDRVQDEEIFTGNDSSDIIMTHHD